MVPFNCCGDYRKAEEQIRKNMEDNPDDLDTKADLGDLFMAMKEYARAEALYGDIKKREPKNPYGYVKTGDLMAARDKWDRAAKEYEQAYMLNPSSPRLLELAVLAFMEMKNYQSALSLCEKKIRETPKDAVAYDLMGRVYAVQEDMRRAEASFQKAISLQPLLSAAHNDLARLYVIEGRTAEAIQKLEGTIKLNPENTGAHLSLARVYGQSGDYKKAILLYENILKKEPSLWVAVNDLAFLLSEYGNSRKDLNRALELALQARKQRPDEPAVLDTLGWIYYKKGDANTALGLIENAGGKNPRSPVINYHLGMVYQKLGKKAEAKEHLRKALQNKENFPGREEAKKALGGV